jgi:glycosyltransferase involved in cell wall biosynthesis
MLGLEAGTQAGPELVNGASEEKVPPPAIRVLTLTPFYPNASNPAEGCFIAEPLRPMQEFGVIPSVLAVQPLHRSSSRLHAGPPAATWVRYASVPGAIGLASTGRFLYASLISKVRKLHRSQRIDLIHAHAALPCGHAAMLLSRELEIPFVVTVHGLDAFFDNQVRGYLSVRRSTVAQSVYRLASRVICISGKVANKVVDNTAALSNTRVIYNSVDTEMFSPGPTDAMSDTILSVGNLIPIKGHELLLRALTHVLPSHPNLTCEIIGDGPERNRLLRLARDFNINDRVHFLGRQSRKQVADALRRCTVFALPSRYEGLGCVYLEAMATGKPAIACRGQGIDEIIRHGRNGFLINPGSLLELIAALTTLLDNRQLRRQIGEDARRTVLDRFTLSHQASELAAVYRECVA